MRLVLKLLVCSCWDFKRNALVFFFFLPGIGGKSVSHSLSAATLSDPSPLWLRDPELVRSLRQSMKLFMLFQTVFEWPRWD